MTKTLLVVLVCCSAVGSTGCAGGTRSTSETRVAPLASDDPSDLDGVVALVVVPTNCPNGDEDDESYWEVEACLARHGLTRDGNALYPNNGSGLSFSPLSREGVALAFVYTNSVPSKVLRYVAIGIIIGANVLKLGIELLQDDWDYYADQFRALLTASDADTSNERAWQTAIADGLGVETWFDPRPVPAPSPSEKEEDLCAYFDDEQQYPTMVGPITPRDWPPVHDEPSVTVNVCVHRGRIRLKPQYIVYEVPTDELLHHVDVRFVNAGPEEAEVEVVNALDSWMQIERWGGEFTSSTRFPGTTYSGVLTYEPSPREGWSQSVRASASGSIPKVYYLPYW